MDKKSKIIADFYNKRALTYKDPLKILDWSSKQAQEIRFEILCQIGNLNNKSILDIGAGFGDLYFYLKSKFSDFKYIGIELSCEILNLAKQMHKDIEFICTDILTDNSIPQADYVISSGIHSVKLFNNKNRLRKLLKRMYELCNIGVGTNFFSSYYKQSSFAYYACTYKPEEVFSLCKQISDYVVFKKYN